MRSCINVYFPQNITIRIHIIMFKIKRFLWASRKTKLPIKSSAIVLDVGSGHNPHPRADVLLDRFAGAAHRGGTQMVIDRLAVIGDATKLPFKDKSFDFIIASHILEHMSDPKSFLAELQRVGKAGYIETPNFIGESLVPCIAHCLEIAVINNTLRIKKKTAPIDNVYVNELDVLRNDLEWKTLYHNNPQIFHVRYYWNNVINFQIHNPEQSCAWVDGLYDETTPEDFQNPKKNISLTWRSIGSTAYTNWQMYLRKKRLNKFDIFSILVCPQCKSELQVDAHKMHCVTCNASYSKERNINFENIIS